MKTFFRLLGFLRPYRTGVLWSLGLAALAIGSTVAIPWLTGQAINDIDDGDRSGLKLVALAIAVAGLARLVLTVARRLVAGRVSLGVEFDLRNRMYSHLQSLELGFFDGQQTGQLMSRATVDLQAVRFFLGYGLIFLVQSFLTLALGAVAMFVLNPPLAAVALAPVPFVILIGWRFGRLNRPALQEVQQRIAELTANAEENVSGVRIVKAFAREAHQAKRFRHSVTRVFDQSMLSTRIRAFYTPLIGFLPNLGLAAILFFGGRQVINGTLSLGDFTAFYAYLLMLISPMRSLGIFLGMAQRAVASGARIFQILDRDPEMKVPEGAPALPPGAGRIELRDVTMTYPGAATPALRDVSLEVEAGTTIALVGADGVGQDDARLAHPRLYDVDSGAVLVDGADVSQVELTSLRGSVALVTDDPFLFSASVHENIAYARPEATREEVEAAARRAQARRVHRRAARRLRHADRRARPDAVRRPAPAAGDRPRAARRPAHPHPRRRDLVGRRLHRARDQVSAAGGDGGPHDVRDRPSPVDDLDGRRDRRARARADRRARQARRAARDLAACTARSSRRGCPTRCS